MARALLLSIVTVLLGLHATLGDAQATFAMSGGAKSSATPPAFAFQSFFPTNISMAVGDTLTITNKLDRASVYLISRTALTNVTLLNAGTTQLSNATVASSNATAAYNSSGIIQSGATFSFKVVSPGNYWIKDIAAPNDMSAVVVVTPTAAAGRLTPADVSTAANSTIALLSAQAATQFPTGLAEDVVTAGFTRRINTTTAELAGFFPLNVTTTPDGGLTLVAGSAAPVQAIVVSPRRLTFTSTSYVVKCPSSNASCLNDTIFNRTATPAEGAIFSTGQFQGPSNFTAPPASVLLGTALSPNSTVWVYLVQFFASYELPVKLAEENTTAPVVAPAPPSAIPSGGSTPVPSSAPFVVPVVSLVVLLAALASIFA